MHLRTPALALALCLVAACAPDDPDDADRAREAELEAERDELEAELGELRRENEALRQELADAEAAPGPDDPQETDLRLAGEPEPARTEDGVTDQLRAYFMPVDDLPDEWQPGVTDWHPTDVPEGFGAGAAYDSPGALVTALAEQESGPALGGDGAWEVTLRVLTADDAEVAAGEAIGGLLEWGYLDDATAGRDLRLHLLEGDDGWFVDEAAQRFHCRRAVTEVDDRPGCL